MRRVISGPMPFASSRPERRASSRTRTSTGRPSWPRLPSSTTRPRMRGWRRPPGGSAGRPQPTRSRPSSWPWPSVGRCPTPGPSRGSRGAKGWAGDDDMTTPAHDTLALQAELARRLGVRADRDAPLANLTTMRVGGRAELPATARNGVELRGIPLFILGRGSNVVVSDRGLRGLVVHVRAEQSRVDGDRYIAAAGVPMARAATEAQKAGLSGLEFGLAIPGTVGGAA